MQSDPLQDTTDTGYTVEKVDNFESIITFTDPVAMYKFFERPNFINLKQPIKTLERRSSPTFLAKFRVWVK